MGCGSRRRFLSSGRRAPHLAAQQGIDRLLYTGRMEAGSGQTDDALSVDHQVRREGEDAVPLRDVAALIDEDRIGEAMLVAELAGLRRRIALLGRVDADHHDTPAAVLLPELGLEMRSLRITGPSPGGKEGQQDDLTPVGA